MATESKRALILVVDADKPSSDTVISALSSLRCTAVVAKNTADAEVWLKTGQPNMIVLDWSEDGDRRAFLQSVAAQWRFSAVPILLLAAAGQAPSHTPVEVVGVIPKPASRDDLFRYLDAVGLADEGDQDDRASAPASKRRR